MREHIIRIIFPYQELVSILNTMWSSGFSFYGASMNLQIPGPLLPQNRFAAATRIRNPKPEDRQQ